MFYIGLYRKQHEKIFLSETTRPRALIFGRKHHLVDLYQVCSNYSTGAKNGRYRYLYVSFKQNSGERLRATWPSCY